MWLWLCSLRLIMVVTLRHSAASLAQSAARQSHNLKVVSSSLTGGTFLSIFHIIFLSH